MAPRPLIQVIGSLNIDFTTLTPRLPGPGETLTARSLTVNAGGKGANQCVACGRASFTSETDHDVEVEMIGAVGADDPYYSSLLKPTLEEAGVDCSGIKEVKDAQTGTATIIVDEGNGENRILVVPGTNHEGMQNVKEVMQRSLSKENIPDVVVLQGEIPKDTVFELIVQLQAKTAIVFNPAPVFPKGIPRELFGMIKVLIVNETEIVQVMEDSSVSKHVPPIKKFGLEKVHLDSFANSLHLTGLKLVIITLGSRGAYYSTDHQQGRFVESVRVSKVVDTTAAGDTFVGYFSVALARHLFAHNGKSDGFDVAGAILKANQQAAKCVQRAGAMQSIPWGNE